MAGFPIVSATSEGAGVVFRTDSDAVMYWAVIYGAAVEGVTSSDVTKTQFPAGIYVVDSGTEDMQGLADTTLQLVKLLPETTYTLYAVPASLDAQPLLPAQPAVVSFQTHGTNSFLFQPLLTFVQLD